MLYMLYGIQHGFPAWKDVPSADELARSFATADGLSCAFLNLSKISNERETYQTDWEVLKASLEPSEPFLKREMELLNPDVIISANVSLSEAGAFRSEPVLLRKHPEDLLDIHRCELNGRTIYWFNTFHFSAVTRGRGKTGLSDYHSFYLPVKEAVESLGDRATPLCQSRNFTFNGTFELTFSGMYNLQSTMEKAARFRLRPAPHAGTGRAM